MNVIKFPPPVVRICCQCDKRATQFIELIDFDTGQTGIKKHFCDEHLPK